MLQKEDKMKKRICPECKKEIRELISIVPGTMTYYLSIGAQRRLHCEAGEFEPDEESMEYLCPKCQETLFLDESDAITFLKGEEFETNPNSKGE